MVGGEVPKPKTTKVRNARTGPKRNDESIQVADQNLMWMQAEDDAMKRVLQPLLRVVL